ncbi:electron transfer flavoprotein [Chlorogloea sp. CCALA 695]|nr:electron transfer flavoprotein [Chlorogloea sp. CCALA 695]
MKLKYLVFSNATALVLGVSGLPSHQLSVQAGEMSRPQMNDGAMSKQKTGMFVAAEHPTQGAVSIINEKGKRYLVFDKAFKSDMGTDLHVILHRDATLPKGGLKKPDYVTLSRLQKVSGSQRYAIPNNINLANFRTVAVWCRMFNATFGYALLPTTSTAQR